MTGAYILVPFEKACSLINIDYYTKNNNSKSIITLITVELIVARRTSSTCRVG